jgi:hypothetical protein
MPPPAFPPPPHSAPSLLVVSATCQLQRSYTPTPIVYRGHLYVCPNNGLLSCYDAKTGERIYRKRLKNKNGYTASPHVTVSLDEATNADLIGEAGHEVRALAELRK